MRVAAAGAALSVAALTLAAVLAGCTSAPATPGPPAITAAWVRPPAGPGLPAAGYLTITNNGDQADVLIGVTSPSASAVEMHRTMTESGMTGMQPVTEIHIPAGGTVTLAPGGFHLMLIDPTALAVGDSVKLVLAFQTAGAITVTAEVKNG